MRTRIHVQDFRGDRVVEDKHELLRVLAQRYLHDANLFTVGPDPGGYPWLSAYVKRDLAVLYYVPEESVMLASANGTEWDGERMVFYENDEGGVNELPNDAVISWSIALSCIEEFCNNLSRPTTIEWYRVS